MTCLLFWFLASSLLLAKLCTYPTSYRIEILGTSCFKSPLILRFNTLFSSFLISSLIDFGIGFSSSSCEEKYNFLFIGFLGSTFSLHLLVTWSLLSFFTLGYVEDISTSIVSNISVGFFLIEEISTILCGSDTFSRVTNT